MQMLGPNSFIFMQFSAKYLQNNRILGIGAHPQENPGSATAPLPTCEHIDTCENITFSHLRLWAVIKSSPQLTLPCSRLVYTWL